MCPVCPCEWAGMCSLFVDLISGAAAMESNRPPHTLLKRSGASRGWAPPLSAMATEDFFGLRPPVGASAPAGVSQFPLTERDLMDPTNAGIEHHEWSRKLTNLFRRKGLQQHSPGIIESPEREAVEAADVRVGVIVVDYLGGDNWMHELRVRFDTLNLERFETIINTAMVRQDNQPTSSAAPV